MTVKVDFRWDIPVLNRAVIAPMIRRKTEAVLKRAQELCPVGTGPTAGRMRDSLYTTYTEDPPVGYVLCPDPAYIFVAGGTRPHPIDPVNGQFLVFPKDGQIVFATHVDHPGTTANPFLTKALREVIGSGVPA